MDIQPLFPKHLIGVLKDISPLIIQHLPPLFQLLLSNKAKNIKKIRRRHIGLEVFFELRFGLYYSLSQRYREGVGRDVLEMILMTVFKTGDKYLLTKCLGVSCVNGFEALTRLLLEDGIAEPEDDYLLFSCEKDLYNIVDLLLKDGRAEPTLECLNSSCYLGHWDSVEVLLKDGRINDQIDDNECLVLACTNGHYNIVELLLKEAKIDSANDNYRAFRVSRHAGHEDILGLLELYGHVPL